MSTEQEKDQQGKDLEPALDPMEDTDRIQKAIEKVMDEETASLPPLPLSGISESGDDRNAHGGPDTPNSTERSDIPDASDTSDHSDTPDDLNSPHTPASPDAPVHTWFFTFMCMNIPIIGWIYLLYLAFSKKKTGRRNFARAYLFYKLIFLLVSALILGILIYIGLGYLDQLLAYMEML